MIVPTQKLHVFGKDIGEKQLRYHNEIIKVSKQFTFDAAHHLHCYEGKCAELHGHTYIVTISVWGRPNEIGLVIDFADLKAAWKQIEPDLDHRYLNASLPRMNPTAENLVVWIAESFVDKLDAKTRFSRIEVVLYETPTSSVTYTWSKKGKSDDE